MNLFILQLFWPMMPLAICVSTSKIFLFVAPFVREGVTTTPIIALFFKKGW
jgi:hypothetical protein